MPASLKHQDVVTVEKNGEAVEVYNWVNILQPSVVRGIGAIEHFEAEIGAGDSSMTPDYVTHWVADELRYEFNIELDNTDIGVIDPTNDEVTVL